MSKCYKHTKLHGFFDLGISLALMAVFGTTAMAIQPGPVPVSEKQAKECKKEVKTNNANEADCKQK